LIYTSDELLSKRNAFVARYRRRIQTAPFSGKTGKNWGMNMQNMNLKKTGKSHPLPEPIQFLKNDLNVHQNK